jgi:hypothetical protein
MDADHETLAAIFASRVALAKKTEEEAVTEARRDYQRTIAWVASSGQKRGAFLWYCDEFDLDASAVRRAITEKRR